MALLVKLGIVWNMGLGHECQYSTMHNRYCNIIQLAIITHWQANHNNSLQFRRFAADSTERLQRALKQRFLQEQVAAGIAGQAQLGECDELRAFGSGLLGQLYDLRGIICAVRSVQIRCCRGNFDKSISHR